MFQNSVLANILNCAHNTLSTDQWKKRRNCGEYLWRLCKLCYLLKIMQHFWTYQQRKSYKIAYNFYYLYLKLHMSLKFKTFNYCLYKTMETKLLFRTVQTVMGSNLFTLSSTFCHLCTSVCMLMMRVSIDMPYVYYNNFCSDWSLLIKFRVLHIHEGRLPTK